MVVIVHRIFVVFLLIGGLLSPSTLRAEIQELVIREEISVYESRKRNSEIIATLKPGDRVPVSTIDYGAWEKIKVEVKGRQRFGWIRKRDIKQSRVRVIDKTLLGTKQQSYHMKSAFGLTFTHSHVSIEEFDFEGESSGSPVDISISDLSGTSSFFGLFYDYAWNEKRMLRFYFHLREHDTEAKVKAGGPIAVNGDFSQEMFSFGATIKRYDSASDNFWWGYGLEIAKLTGATATSSGVVQEVPDEDLPFYILPHLASGYDFNVSDRFYFLVDGKFHLIANGGGLAYALDLGLSLAYSY